MGREVRRVPPDWQHPKYEGWEGRQGFKPLYDGNDYQEAHDEFLEKLNKGGLQAAIDCYGGAPDEADYMPRWAPEQRTHLMMYETTSEGTPISPPFETPEELARWLVDNKASALARGTATYEQWLNVARGGWAPSAVIADGRMMSGVEAMAEISAAPPSERQGRER